MTFLKSTPYCQLPCQACLFQWGAHWFSGQRHRFRGAVSWMGKPQWISFHSFVETYTFLRNNSPHGARYVVFVFFLVRMFVWNSKMGTCTNNLPVPTRVIHGLKKQSTHSCLEETNHIFPGKEKVDNAKGALYKHGHLKNTLPFLWGHSCSKLNIRAQSFSTSMGSGIRIAEIRQM